MHEVETMAWTGARPWHGLGIEITNPDEITQGRVFMERAGLDWSVHKTELIYGAADSEYAGPELEGLTVENQFHLIRSTDGALLSSQPVTEQNYHIVQNVDMFDVFDPFLSSGDMTLNTAGSLFHGQRVWALAQLKTGFTLPGNDQVNNFLLFSIDHSGRGANTAFYTAVRVVCNNTLRMATSSAKNVVRDNHRTPFDIELMRDALVMVRNQSVEFETLAGDMAAKKISAEQRRDYFRTVYKQQPKENASGALEDTDIVRRAMLLANGQETKGKTDRDIIARQQEIIDRMAAGQNIDAVTADLASDQSSLTNPGWDNKASQDTVWGAYNTVTYMEDHAPMKRSRSADNQLSKALYGQVAIDRKVIALDEARKLVAA